VGFVEPDAVLREALEAKGDAEGDDAERSRVNCRQRARFQLWPWKAAQEVGRVLGEVGEETIRHRERLAEDDYWSAILPTHPPWWVFGGHSFVGLRTGSQSPARGGLPPLNCPNGT